MVFAGKRFKLVFIFSSIVYFIFFGFLTNMFIIFKDDGTVYSFIPQTNHTMSQHTHPSKTDHMDIGKQQLNSQQKGNIAKSNDMNVEMHQGDGPNHVDNSTLVTEESDPIPLLESHYPDFRFIVCCNNFGYVPMMIVYVTDHFSFLLIPLNFFLGVVISLLVGINVSINAFAFKGLYGKNKRISQGRLFGGLGLTTGLLVGCPTCAGSLLYSVVGFTSLVTFSSLGLYQMFFIVISIPFLIASLFIMTKYAIKNDCNLPTK